MKLQEFLSSQTLCFFLSSSLFCWVFSGWFAYELFFLFQLTLIHPFTCSLILIISVSFSDFSSQSRNKTMAAASSSSASPKTTTERRGIPGAQFVEDVETYLSQTGFDVNSALAFLQERSLLFLSIYPLLKIFLVSVDRLLLLVFTLGLPETWFYKNFVFLVYILMLIASFNERV